MHPEGGFPPLFPLDFQAAAAPAASSAGCPGQLSRAASAPLNELLMSLQLLIGRARAPRAGRAAEWDAEPGRASLCREQHWAGSGLAVPAPVPGGMPGSGYRIPSSREPLHGVGDGAGEVWGEERPLPTGDEWLPINTCQGARKRWVDYPPRSMR